MATAETNVSVPHEGGEDFFQGTSEAASAPQTVSIPPPSQPSVVRRKVTGFVGFSNLPQQWHQKCIRKGFNLNLIVAGVSGLGKSTLLNTLFESNLHNPADLTTYDEGRGVTMSSVTADVEESDVRLRLTVIDTPGFGDHVNNLDSWKPIVEEIDTRNKAYLDGETGTNRANNVDKRVHACLYFIEPTGHALKPLDIVVMKKLHRKVNLIPIIAKADTMTDEELAKFKTAILNDIRFQGIEIFHPPTFSDDDQEVSAETGDLIAKIPFAVVGSTNYVQTPDGRTVLGRQYPWGVIEVGNEEHCDFVKLRALLIRNHLEDLRERTSNVLYENYRTEKLLEMGIVQDNSVFVEVDPAARQEEERKLHEQRLAKMEAEMRSVFQQKVTEKEMKLKKSEAELFAKHKEIRADLEKQHAELEARKQRLEQQIQGHEDAKRGPRRGFGIK